MWSIYIFLDGQNLILKMTLTQLQELRLSNGDADTDLTLGTRTYSKFDNSTISLAWTGN